MGIVNTLFGQRSWFLKAEDGSNPKELQGQFEPEDLTENIRSNYSQTTSLNRSHPITQFISGDLETITFTATLWNRDVLFGKAEEHLNLLKNWTRRDAKLGHPPILNFWVGDGMVTMARCTIASLGGIKYHRPTLGGLLKGVTLQITLNRYENFNLEGDVGETRYHKSKEGDYYEMLTQREYGSAIMGDLIRKRNPDKPNIVVTDVIALPTKDKFRKDRVEPTSIPFQNSFKRRPSPQRALRLYMFDQRDRSKISHILKG